MSDDRAQRLEEVNYRQTNEDGPSCVYCSNSDNNLDRLEDVIISYCYFFNMKVDELHICDLFG